LVVSLESNSGRLHWTPPAGLWSSAS
jgi:hypothetical protein